MTGAARRERVVDGLGRPAEFTALLVAAVLAACGDGRSGEERDRRSLDEMRQEIVALAGAARAEQVDQCRALGLGAKPCGGPWEYLIYSADRPDTLEVRRRVADYNTFNGRLNRKWGWVSDCSLPPTPVLGVVEGRCIDVRHAEGD